MERHPKTFAYQNDDMTKSEILCLKIEETLKLNAIMSFARWYPDNIYLFKFNNRNTRKRCEICSKLTIKTP